MSRFESMSAKNLRNFWKKVKAGPECWEWTGGKIRDGYGKFNANGKTLRAHRVSWEIHNERIPSGMLVLHTCDNRSCVNPAHLFLGTNQDNTNDMMCKGRNNPNIGESHPHSKLALDDITAIKQAAPYNSQTELSRVYGVSQPVISRILSGKLWRHHV